MFLIRKIISIPIMAIKGLGDFFLIVFEMCKPDNADIRKIAYRNLFRNKRRTIIISLSIMGAMIGLTWMSGWSMGLNYEMRQSVIKSGLAHIQIFHEDYRINPGLKHTISNPNIIIDQIASVEETVVITPRSQVEGIINTSRSSLGLMIMGIDPSLEKHISLVGEKLVEGELSSLKDENKIVISKFTAEKLNTKLGSKLVIMGTNTDGDIEMASAIIVGIFNSGYPAYDKGFAFVHNEFFSQIFNLDGNITSVAITVHESTEPEKVKAEIKEILKDEPIEVVTWLEVAPALIKQMDQMEIMLYVVYSIFYIAVCFGLVNTMLMAVYERRREIGVLLAIGMQTRKVKAMIMTETFLIIAFSGIMGIIFSISTTLLFLPNGLDLSEFSSALESFGITTQIPFIYTFRIVIIPLLSAILFGMIAGFFPARRAGNMNPVESIRAF